MKLTKALQAKARKPGQHRDTAQGAPRGLYLDVKRAADGGVTASWLYRYSSPTTHRMRWMGLGSADCVSQAEAREKARNARAMVLRGDDPIAARAKAKATTITFGEACAQYIKAHEPGWKNEKHRYQWRATLEQACRRIGDLPVAAVDTAACLRVLEPIWQTTPETASRLQQRMARVLDWAKVRGYRAGDNPATWRGCLDQLLPKQNGAPKHHPALPYVQVPEFMKELRANSFISARALEVTILTALRTSEVILAQWDEIDFAAKLWTVPAARMKARKEHKVPLADRALQILRELPRDGEYVFPGGKEGKPLSNMAMLNLLRGMRPGVVPHGFRSTFRDWCSERTAFPGEVAEMVLAHTIPSAVERAYRRGTLLEKRRQLMNQWSRYCASESPAAVSAIPLRRA